MFRTALTISFILIASCASAANYGSMQIDWRTQRSGGDYTNFYTNNLEQCAQSCTRDARCQAFDFNINDNSCWLKDRTPLARPSDHVVSGTRKWTNSGPGNGGVVGGIRLERGKAHPGGDYTNYFANNPGQCAQSCANDPRCRAFDYNTSNKTCWLKDRVNMAQNVWDVVTGVKQQNYGGGSWNGGSNRPSYHPPGDIYWDYSANRPCPSGFVNCDVRGNCGMRGNEATCRKNVQGGYGGHRPGDIYWDYSANRPCPSGYVNCDMRGNCGKRGNSCR